eukprot:Tbor_TRINITY_DN3348_c0_g1::TRINITY_DN3348_c0_g1_i1::g.23470::m.23470/K00600/glyA, SHMT; glycine hydroxymethyltransferase
MSSYTFNGLKTLVEHDPAIADIIQKEMARQYRGLEMIASENFTSKAVIDCLGSALTNKYAEGEVGNRYYGGTKYVDEVEALAKERSLMAFGLDPKEWGVNVQPYSGSPANFAVYTGLLKPHDRIMGLDLPSGGHLTHGFYTAKKKISATSIFFESFPYRVDSEGVIDYAELERISDIYRPSMVIIGASAYTKDYEYQRIRTMCDSLGCLLMMDMAHTAGLIAGKVLRSPFPFCDVVTTTTHKSLCGPRSGMIFFRKIGLDGKPTDYESRINQAVFPGLQGGPHIHQIAGIATQMKEVCSENWPAYAATIQANARSLAKEMMALGHKLIGNGTDNHLVLWNVKDVGLTGSKVEKLLENLSISVNKNTIPGDKSALSPGGIRLGVCALTTRQMKPEHMVNIAGFLNRAVILGQKIQAACGAKLAKEFFAAMEKEPHVTEIAALREEVEDFATKFVMPGFDVENMKYKDGITV